MKNYLLFSIFFVSVKAAALSPNTVDCRDFTLRQGAKGWELTEHHAQPLVENNGYNGELRNMPDDNLTFGRGETYREIDFVSETLDTSGAGTLELDEVIDEWDFDTYVRYSCQAYTLEM